MPNPPELDGEEWRDVVGREGEYMVSSLGRVWSAYRGGRLLSTWYNGDPKKGDDYYRVCLGRGERRYVHHLIAEAWHGERPEGLLVCHKDGDHHHNHPSNLYWGTYEQNVADSKAHGTYRPPVSWRARRQLTLFGAGSGGEAAVA